MTVAHLVAARDAALSVAGKSGIHVFDDFLIFNGMGQRQLPGIIAFTLWTRVRNRLSRI